MSTVAGGIAGGPITDSVQELADEIAAWMGVGGAFVSGGKAWIIKDGKVVLGRTEE